MSDTAIHTVSWIDWSQGKVLGNYRTYSVSDARYIISGTAAFVTVVGASAWQIYAVLIHRCIVSRSKPADIITLQHRLVYRNDATATFAATSAFWIFWYWKLWTLCPPRRRVEKRATHVTLKSLGLIVPALILFAGFTVVGVISSRITSPDYKDTVVLLQSQHSKGQCGIALFDGFNGSFDAFDQKAAKVVNSISCNFFAKQKLNYTTEGVPCPFGEQGQDFSKSICNFNGNKAAFRLTTDLLDSHDDFEINAAPQDRLKLRKQLTCSPLSQDGFISQERGHGSEANATLTNYNYGGAPNIAISTWQYNPAGRNDNVPFEIFTLSHNATGPAEWIPISNLSRTDADVTIVFIAPNSIAFRGQVADSVFQTSYSTTIPLPVGTLTVFYPDYAVSVIGCVEQYSICKNDQECTPAGGQEALGREIEALSLNTAHFVTAQRFLYMISWANVYSSVNGIGPEALRMWNLVYDFVSPAIPDNQWQLEVTGWFETNLAKWQAFMVEYASTTINLGPNGHLGFPVTNATLDKVWRDQSSNQRVSNLGRYSNISVFGFAFIWAVGGFIVLLSLFLKMLLSQLDDTRHKDLPPGASEKQIAWNIDGKLQQHRIALQTANYTALRGGVGDVLYLDEVTKLPLPFQAYRSGDDTKYRPWPLEKADRQDGVGLNGTSTEGEQIHGSQTPERSQSSSTASDLNSP